MAIWTDAAQELASKLEPVVVAILAWWCTVPQEIKDGLDEEEGK